MLFSFSTISILLSAGLGALTAPIVCELQPRANPCFITGTVSLPAEVADGLSAFASSIICDTSGRSPAVVGLAPGLSSRQEDLAPVAPGGSSGGEFLVPGDSSGGEILVPGVSSGGEFFRNIDFQKSALSPLGFALAEFKTPANPATADLNKLHNQLNDYLAVEAGVRSHGGGAILDKIKSVKFFLQFQIARVKTAQGQKLSVADTVGHQLGKVLKNAVGASDAEKAQVNTLATQL